MQEAAHDRHFGLEGVAGGELGGTAQTTKESRTLSLCACRGCLRNSTCQNVPFLGWLDNKGHPKECDCVDCRCLREGFRRWNRNLDGAEVAARFGLPLPNRDGLWILPPGWDGCVHERGLDPDMPQWIRIGPEHRDYNFKLVHMRPLVFRGTRSSDDGWSQPHPNDVLWLFQKYEEWVAGHADKSLKQILHVLEEASLVWSTTARAPWLPGSYWWWWVDTDATDAARVLKSPWSCGTFTTSKLERPP